MLELVQPRVEKVGSARELAPTPPWELALASEWQEQMDKYLSWNDAKVTVLEGSPAGTFPAALTCHLLNNIPSNQAHDDKGLITGSPKKRKHLTYSICWFP